jgi:hypothetical protein
MKRRDALGCAALGVFWTPIIPPTAVLAALSAAAAQPSPR